MNFYHNSQFPPPKERRYGFPGKEDGVCPFWCLNPHMHLEGTNLQNSRTIWVLRTALIISCACMDFEGFEAQGSWLHSYLVCLFLTYTFNQATHLPVFVSLASISKNQWSLFNHVVHPIMYIEEWKQDRWTSSNPKPLVHLI